MSVTSDFRCTLEGFIDINSDHVDVSDGTLSLSMSVHCDVRLSLSMSVMSPFVFNVNYVRLSLSMSVMSDFRCTFAGFNNISSNHGESHNGRDDE